MFKSRERGGAFSNGGSEFQREQAGGTKELKEDEVLECMRNSKINITRVVVVENLKG